MIAAPHYTATAKWLHWLVAVLVFVSFGLGLKVVNMHHLTVMKVEMFNWHKWLGVLVFALSVVRFGWRIVYPPPSLPAAIPVWQRRSSRSMHYLLYLLCLAVVISGYFFTLAVGFPVVLFGWIPLPVLMGAHPELKDGLRELHRLLSYALMTAVTMHMAAALKHHWWNRDEVFKRMLPQSWIH